MERNRSLTRILAYALLLCITLSSFVFTAGAASKKVDGFSGEDPLEYLWTLGNSQDNGDVTVYPGDEIFIPLTANMFSWSDGRTPLPQQAVRLVDIKRDVEVRTRVQAGWEVLDYVQLDTDMVPGRPFYHPSNTSKTGRTAGILIVFADELVSVEDVEFTLDIYLKADDSLDDDYKITVRGQMVQPQIDITPETDHVVIGDGTVTVAEEFGVLKDLVNMDIGNGITMSKLPWHGYKYYATNAYKDSTSLAPEDYPVIYPIIHGVYNIKSINMDKGVTRVKIVPVLDDEKPEIREFYVYGEDMVYLGKTTDVLPYSEIYILTIRELTSFETGEYSDSLADQPVQEAVDEYPVNIAIGPDVDPASKEA